VAGGIISFLAGLGASLKGWKDFFKKDEPSISVKQEMINRSDTSTPIQAQTVNIYQAAPPPNSQSLIPNSDKPKPKRESRTRYGLPEAREMG